MIRRAFVLCLLAVFATLAWLLRPLPAVPVTAVRPAASYDEAVRRARALQGADTLALWPGCATAVRLHAGRAPRAIVLVHGITNCPLQWRDVAETLFARGDHVIVPRMPHHGLADRMTEDLARLRAGEVTALAAECVGIARGLGDTVVVMGLSSGGVLTAWLAQELDGVDRAVALAPAFAPAGWPRPVAAIATRLAARLPNAFVWWDDDVHERLPGPPQCYPRFSTRAMAESYALGARVLAGAHARAPHARDLAVVTTASDEAVEYARVLELVASWRGQGRPVREVRFRADEHVHHDMVDPRQVGAKPALVHPVLVALARGERPPGR